VSESGPAGYSSAASPDCAGTIAAGETKTCTITADDHPTPLAVYTTFDNDNNDTLTPAAATLAVSAAVNSTPAGFPGSGPAGTTVTVNPGTYDVGLRFPTPGYTITFAGDCSGTIAAGETKTCTITADDRPTHGTLYVAFDVVNNNGGTAVAADWTVDVSGSNPSPASFAGVAVPGPGQPVQIDSGAYNVTA